MDVTADPVTMPKDKILGILSVNDAKKHERVLHAREDGLLEGYIRTAFGWLDGPNGYLNGYSILERTFMLYLPSIDCDTEIKVRPIVDESTIAVAALAADGTYSVAPAGSVALWKVDDCHHLQALVPARARVVRPRAIRLTFKAGHSQADDVPDEIRQAMMLLVGHWYQNREAAFADPRSAPVSREIRFGVRALLSKARLALDHD